MKTCHYFETNLCQSCSWIQKPMLEQHLDKTQDLQSITGIIPDPLVSSVEWGFRHKIKMAVSGNTETPCLGLISGVELLDCPVQTPELNSKLPALKNFITKWKLTPYDITSRQGELKYLILTRSPSSGETILRFVLRSKEALDRVQKGLSELQDFSVVSVNIQPLHAAILEGPEEVILTPKRFIQHHLGGLTLCFSPQSFVQTNPFIAEKLYGAAAEWLAPWRGQQALDLFCGVGGFALHLAKNGFSVCGIEINPHSIEMAHQSAVLSGLTARFEAAASESIAELWDQIKPHVVVVNPPRRGLGESLALILSKKPELLLYSSCSSESLQKDLQSLIGYKAIKTQVFDMFPHTKHYESLTLLHKI